MNNRIFATLLPVLALCAGCAHQKYQGDERSSKEVAVINDSYTMSLRWDRAQIIAVDDERSEYSDWVMPEQVEVLPGKHSVSIYCWHGFKASHRSGLQGRVGSVEFEAKPGHEYQVFCGTSNGRYVRWIKDLTAEEIVGGTTP